MPEKNHRPTIQHFYLYSSNRAKNITLYAGIFSGIWRCILWHLEMQNIWNNVWLKKELTILDKPCCRHDHKINCRFSRSRRWWCSWINDEFSYKEELYVYIGWLSVQWSVLDGLQTIFVTEEVERVPIYSGVISDPLACQRIWDVG